MNTAPRTSPIRSNISPVVAMISLAAAQSLYAATIDVRVIDTGALRNAFVPNEVTIEAGDTVRFTNLGGGMHAVVADDGSWGRQSPSSAPWVDTHTFENVGTEYAHCSFHSMPGLPISDRSQNIKINVIERSSQPPAFAINQGIAGAWFNAATSGQGILFDIEPDSKFIFGAIFTYDTVAAAKLGAPEHRWLTVQGNYNGNTAVLPIFLTSGGVFDQSNATTTAPVGTATLTFNSCSEGNITYVLNDPPLSGSIPLQRVISGTEALCDQLATPDGP